MKPSEYQKTIQCQFDCLTKKVVKGIVRNYHKELSRRKKREALFCELPDIMIDELAKSDEYDTNFTMFNICNIDIRVTDDKLAQALNLLPEKQRDIMLMYYFLEMSDTEIGNLLNMSRRSSHRNRANSLNEMRKVFKKGEIKHG